MKKFLQNLQFLHARKRKNPPLKQRFEAIDDFRDWSYAEVLNCIGRNPKATVFRKDGQIIRTWSDGNYSITLLFTSADVCLGVEEERT